MKLSDPNLVFDSRTIDSEHNLLIIRAHMGTEGAECTRCGTWSNSVQGHYTRVLKDFSVMGMPTEIHIVTRTFSRTFYCRCEECDHKTFAEPLPFADRYSRKTNRAWDHVDELHTCMSSAEAAEIVSDSLFPVHFSTLIRHLWKYAADVEPVRVNVVAVCIDDLALRMRFSYATAIMDAFTHELLDIIPSHQSQDVADELAKYHGVQIVCRDGAACFRNGVLKLDDSIVQVTDRFPILKGCTDAATLYLRAVLPPVLPLTSPVEKHAVQLTEAAIQRRTRILTARQLHGIGMPVKAIAEEMGISESAVRTYLKTDPDSVGSGNRQKFEKLLPYLKKIGALMADNVAVKTIFEVIKERSCKGSIDLLYEYVQKRKAGDISVPTENAPSRAQMVKRLFRPLEEIPGLDKETCDRAPEVCPVLAEVIEWVDQLRDIMESQDPTRLDDWIDDSRKFKSGAVQSCVDGLLRDREGVYECVELPFLSNGPMEGTVNKIKGIRRIMYGRCRFPFFRLKVLAKERIRRTRQERLKQETQGSAAA